ncbi:UvrABC system protein C [Spirochaetia bacterium]|nr:UvrABC system protein C [Spirochaetia bacterium]
MYEELKAFAHNAPILPGVYLWRDSENHIIYIGKAKVLRNRLSSYFSGAKDLKTAALIDHAASIETIITGTEYEALLLENTLIKQHRPRYNIALKDGSGYPFIVITREPFPRVLKISRKSPDYADCFGPFPHGAEAMLAVFAKSSLRKCSTLRKRPTPCFYYHIGRCRAPCCGRISESEYKTLLNPIREILCGDPETITFTLRKQMHTAASNLHFEEAAMLRDLIRALEAVPAENAVLDSDPTSRDYISWAADGIFAAFSVFSLRNGALVSRDSFQTCSAADFPDSLETFIMAYYGTGRDIPAVIYLDPEYEENQKGGGTSGEIQKDGEYAVASDARPPAYKAYGFSVTPPAPSGIEDNTTGWVPAIEHMIRWFREQYATSPAISIPADKHHRAILGLVRQNALEDLRVRIRSRGLAPALEELRHILNLATLPARIEGFDIAHLGGTDPVASLVSFKDGFPDKKEYRLFKLRSVVGTSDDYAAMREVIRRRYTRLLNESKELPDLILVDGGRGQVNAAAGVLHELGAAIPVVGLAKQHEELWLHGSSQPIRLTERSEALKVLQAVRDETHRKANGFNQKLREKALAFTVLESVSGIGKKRSALLMKTYRSLAALAAADPDSIASLLKISPEQGRAIRNIAVQTLNASHKSPESVASLAEEALAGIK